MHACVFVSVCVCVLRGDSKGSVEFFVVLNDIL